MNEKWINSVSFLNVFYFDENLAGSVHEKVAKADQGAFKIIFNL